MRAVVAVSLANLCYLRIWDVLLHQPERHYLAASPYSRVDFVAAIIGVGLLTVGLYFLIKLVWLGERRWVRAIAMLTVLLVFLFPLDFVRRSSGVTFEAYSGIARYMLILIAAGGLLVGSLLFRQRFYAVLFWALAILSPYAGINLAYAVANIAYPGQEEPRQKLSIPALGPEHVATNRVIWIIFDEWDQAATFEKRPPDLKLPVLDAFIKNAVVATQAYPPSNRTMISLPALLTGRLVSEAEGRGDSELRVNYAGENEWRDFRNGDNIVTEMLRAGKKVAVLGWYHPYSRILPVSPNLTDNSWGFPAFQGIRRSNVVSAVAAQYAFLALPQFGRMASRDLYAEMHTAALAAVADPSIDFVFLHYGIPHLPGIYDAAEDRLSIALKSNTSGYYSNLALVDRCLGDLLTKVNKAGLHDATAFVLTSDHWWRTAPWIEKNHGYPVPLIIRPKAGGTMTQADTVLCTTSVRAIVSDLLGGKCADILPIQSLHSFR